LGVDFESLYLNNLKENSNLSVKDITKIIKFGQKYSLTMENEKFPFDNSILISFKKLDKILKSEV
jgi:hypothetical protein